jgi:cytidine deaminase
MEPYPKSKAKDLHSNEIEIEKTSPGRVSFVPFLGIAPYRYRDIFQKGRRKNDDGTAKRWIKDVERPMVELSFPGYVQVELSEMGTLIGAVRKQPADDKNATTDETATNA